MLPAVEPDGRSTSFRILLYSLALLSASLIPAFLGMSGQIYLGGAVLLGMVFVYFGARLIVLDLPRKRHPIKTARSPAVSLLDFLSAAIVRLNNERCDPAVGTMTTMLSALITMSR